MRRLAGLLLLLSGTVFAQEYALTVHFVRPVAQFTEWTLTRVVDGGTDFKATRSDKIPFADTHFQMSDAMSTKLGGLLTSVRDWNSCETAKKNLAQVGTKTFTYTPAGKTAVSCSFNYSDDEGMQEAGNSVVAIAFTLEEGSRLEHLHRFDRLGLDAETQAMARAIQQGDALELQAIEPVLTALVQDEQVIGRVRERVARMLQAAAK